MNIKLKIVEVACIGEIGAGKVVPFTSVSPRKRIKFAVPTNFAHHPSEISAIKVKGDSMSGDRILDGDNIVFRKYFELSEVRNKICLVSIVPTSDMILRRVEFRNETVYLIPSNPDYSVSAYIPSDIEIIGIVVLNPIIY